MARPRINSYWQERVKEITENEPRVGPGPIFRRLKGEARKLDRKDYPSERTVGRIRQEFRAQKQGEQRAYREFHWPECMDQRVLPWSASRAGLELLGYFQQLWGRRPLVGLVAVFWRVSQAAEDAPLDERYFAAREVYQSKVFGRDNIAEWDPTLRYWEKYFAYAPWRSDKAREAFEAVIESDPLLKHAEFGPNIPIEVDIGRDPEAIDKFLGYGLSEKERQAFINRSGEALQGREVGEE
jgi:hypothetical protein